MSKYSGFQDFKDLLDDKFESFNLFKSMTDGILYQWGDNGQLKICFIEDPLDLVKYYSCKVASTLLDKSTCTIYLEPPTQIQKWFETTPTTTIGFDEDDINKVILAAKNGDSGYAPDDPRLIGAYLILYGTLPERRYII